MTLDFSFGSRESLGRIKVVKALRHRLCTQHRDNRPFIRRCLQLRRQRAAMQQQTSCEEVPYIQDASEAVARILSKHGVLVVHKPVKTLRTALMRPKDSLEPNEKSNVIYGLECSQCPVEYASRNWPTFEDPYEGAQRGRQPARNYLSSVGTHRGERTHLRL